MRRVALVLVSALMLTACGHESTLAGDDQEFCEDVTDGHYIPLYRQYVNDAHDDYHWSSSGESLAFVDASQTARNVLENSNPIDAHLKELRDKVSESILEVNDAILGAEDSPNAPKEEIDAAFGALNDLTMFCKDNA